MKINQKVLSVPPYISVTWNYVEGMYLKGATLVIMLFGHESVNIPGLKPEIIETIFKAHADYLEHEAMPLVSSKPGPLIPHDFPFEMPGMGQPFPVISTGNGSFQFGISSMDGYGTAMEHNPDQADAPDIPAEILKKIGAIVKIVASDEAVPGPSAVQNCNCPHCQITRAITGDTLQDEDFNFLESTGITQEANQEVSNEPWHIQQTGENLFKVVDRSNLTEFNVFLGHPVGCTCGKEGCEHILAVLKS
jgi:hypothetical protein